MRTKALMMTTTLALLWVTRASAQPAADLFPVEPGVNTERGFAVALDGDLLAVGAPLDDENGRDAGAVYVFRWESSSWEQEAKLTGDDVPGAGPALRFGSAVALRGGILAVGALGEGAVYVFAETEFGWIRQAKLTDPAGSGAGTFGRALAVDGGRLAVGAVNPHGRARGAVYLYAGAPWTAPPRRLESAQPGERFGQAVALAGELLVVGAPGNSRGAESYAGAAHVFGLGGAAPVKIARLTAADGGGDDQLGAAVATDGTTVVLGAPTADVEGSNSGAVYVSTCALGACSPPQLLTGAEPPAEPAAEAAMFGYSVAVDGDLLAAGVHGSALPLIRGGLRIFRGAGATWTEEAVPLPGNAEERDLVGFAVALDGERAVAAAVLGDQGGPAAGAVWSFIFDPEEGWREEAEAVARDPLLRPEDLEAAGRFGVSVAATEQYLVVGALREPADDSPGAVYVYRWVRAGWRQEARLTSPAGEDARDAFGTAVAVDGESLLVGAPVGVESDLVSPPVEITGAAYLFVRRNGAWSLERPFYSGDAPAGGAFGAAVAIEGSILAIGAPLADSQGAVYVYERGTTGWSAAVPLVSADATSGEGFGAALSMRQGTLAIGAPGRLEPVVIGSRVPSAAIDIPVGEGAVYVTRRLALGEWTAPVRPTGTPGLLASDRLGAAVALGDGVLAVGAPGRRNGDGAVLVFTAAGTTWTYRAQIALLEEHEREFGTSVAVQGKRLLVGAPGAGDLPPNDLDHAFLFEGEGAEWTLIATVDAINPPHGDRFGTAVALTSSFFAVTNPGPAGGDRVTVFTLRQNEAAEEK